MVAFVYTGRKAWKGETHMPYIKLFLACAASWLLLLPLRAEAADVYSVIYSDVSYYNGNPVECDWIANAVLYASASYNVDPLLITAVDDVRGWTRCGKLCKRFHNRTSCKIWC